MESADARPTEAAVARFDELQQELTGHIKELQRILETDLGAFNDLVRKKDVPPVF